jgi:hypothetical protein
MRRHLDPFFDCRWLWSVDDLPDPAPYFIYEDEDSDPFARELIAAGQLSGSLVSVTRSIDALRANDHPVYMEAPVWDRRHMELAAAGVRGDRARVLLYFNNDPTGHWDFAKACGPQLQQVLRKRRLDSAAMAQLGPFLESWLGGRAFGGRLLPMSAFTLRDYGEEVAANLPKIHQVMGAFADEESRATYARMLYGTQEDLLGRFVEKVFGAQQYMELAQIRPGDVIVNCGVGSGWELPYFLCRLEGRGRIFNFDPNIIWQYTGYAGLISRFGDLLDERKIILGGEDGVIDLPVGLAGMVRPDNVGLEMIAQGVPTKRYVSQKLDTLSENGIFDRLDFLKMDVEGGEGEILRGAMETIRRFRPKLAVAIYHEPEHFWDYPALLMDQLEDYRYYLRQYGYSRFETLLYAIPLEDSASRSGSEGLRRPTHGGPRAWDARVTTHLRDREARAYYAGDQRLLARISGSSMDTAEIGPAPLIDTDKVAAIFEDSDTRFYVAVHGFGPENRQLAVGRSEQAAHLRWIHSQSLSEAFVCIPAPGPAGAPGYGIVDTAEGRTYAYAIGDEGVTPVLTLETPTTPVLVQRHVDGSASAIFVEEEGSALLRLDYGASGHPVGDGSRLKLDGKFAGFVSSQRTGEPPRRALAVMGSSGTIQIVDAFGRNIAELDRDDRFEFVATFRAGERDLPLLSEHL